MERLIMQYINSHSRRQEINEYSSYPFVHINKESAQKEIKDIFVQYVKEAKEISIENKKITEKMKVAYDNLNKTKSGSKEFDAAKEVCVKYFIEQEDLNANFVSSFNFHGLELNYYDFINFEKHTYKLPIILSLDEYFKTAEKDFLKVSQHK